MPRIEIDVYQERGVTRWVEGQEKPWVTAFPYNDQAARVYKVGDEPLLLLANEAEDTRTYTLLCSDNHARALEAAGIVRFTPELQQGVQTP